jgi:hypothetical protein
MLAIGLDLEGQEVPEVEASRAPWRGEEAVAGTAKVDVHVAGGSRSFEAKLEDNASLGHGAISQMLKDAGEEAVVDEHLAKATHAVEEATADPWSTAWRTRSAETLAASQSRTVRRGIVTGITPTQARALFGRSAKWRTSPLGRRRRLFAQVSGAVM